MPVESDPLWSLIHFFCFICALFAATVGNIWFVLRVFNKCSRFTQARQEISIPSAYLEAEIPCVSHEDDSTQLKLNVNGKIVKISLDRAMKTGRICLLMERNSKIGGKHNNKAFVPKSRHKSEYCLIPVTNDSNKKWSNNLLFLREFKYLYFVISPTEGHFLLA